MTDQLMLQLINHSGLREITASDIITTLHANGCTGRAHAVSTRALCSLLGIPENQERHLRPVIRQAMRETVSCKCEWMVVAMAGSGCYLANDPDEIKAWNHRNFGAALTLLAEVREITPDILNARAHELMEVLR